MRGKAQAQPEFLKVVNLNAAMPADHQLRGIKKRVNVCICSLFSKHRVKLSGQLLSFRLAW
jgi:hypothetical protein